MSKWHFYQLRFPTTGSSTHLQQYIPKGHQEKGGVSHEGRAPLKNQPRFVIQERLVNGLAGTDCEPLQVPGWRICSVQKKAGKGTWKVKLSVWGFGDDGQAGRNLCCRAVPCLHLWKGRGGRRDPEAPLRAEQTRPCMWPAT